MISATCATVSVTTASAATVFYVPSSAVRAGANGASTVRVRQGDRTVTRTVTVGVRGDTYVEIKSGLSEGERVVTSGEPASQPPGRSGARPTAQPATR